MMKDSIWMINNEELLQHWEKQIVVILRILEELLILDRKIFQLNINNRASKLVLGAPLIVFSGIF